MTAQRAAYMRAPTIAVERAGRRPPPPGHVKIDVAYTGICGTDLLEPGTGVMKVLIDCGGVA